MKKIFLFILSITSLGAMAQSLNVPSPSPLQTINQKFATSNVEVSYSRPSMKGRKIFGDLVLFDSLWRTGANACTKIYFGEDVTINGSQIKQGRYALFTIPGKTEWTIIINKDTTLGGTFGYKAENDVTRFKVKSSTLPYSAETFTIDFNNLKNDSLTVSMRWDKTEVSFVVAASYDERVMKQIESVMNPADKKPYYQAAVYYLENGKDLDKALEWVIKAENINPDAYWITHTKAKIYLKKGDKANAIVAAEASKAKAVAGNNREYVAMNDKLIADAKK